MKITVSSTDVASKDWSKNGRSGVIRTQEAVAENATFRNKIRLDLGTNDPWPVGEYSVNIEDAVTVGDFGDLKLPRRLPLVAVKAPAAVKSA